MTDDPVDRIAWCDVGSLNANDYNPNHVLPPELRLLERSIMLTGWVQPILVGADGTIIDGYHRWRLSRESPAIRERYEGRVPVVRLDIPRPEAMILTVRMNRAKGVHGAVKMHELVRELIDEHGYPPATVGEELGASIEEVDILYREGVFAAKKTSEWRYSKAWYPAETGVDRFGRKRATGDVV